MNPTRPLLAAALLALLPACRTATPVAAIPAPQAATLTARLDGPGFFTFTDAAERTVYVREAGLALSSDRELTTLDGTLLVSPRIAVPCDATLLQIDAEGTVTAWVDGDAMEIGRLEIVTFENPERLTALGQGRFTEAADAPDGFRLIPTPDPIARVIATPGLPDLSALAAAEDPGLSPGSE